MNQNLLIDFQKQISDSNGIGVDLLKKNEFAFLTNYLLPNELVDSLVVGQIDGKLNLIMFTNQRLFFVEKNPLNLHHLVRYGLDQIVNLELKKNLDQFELVVTLLNDQKIKIAGLSEKKAKLFGKNLFRKVQNWKISDFLL